MKIELTGKDLFFLIAILALCVFCLVNFFQLKNAALVNTVLKNQQDIVNISNYLNQQIQRQQQPAMRIDPNQIIKKAPEEEKKEDIKK